MKVAVIVFLGFVVPFVLRGSIRNPFALFFATWLIAASINHVVFPVETAFPRSFVGSSFNALPMFVIGFFVYLFSQRKPSESKPSEQENPWQPYDPHRHFRNRIIGVIGAWQFTKLEELMKSGSMFEHEFFASGTFLNTPEENRLDLFLKFLKDWGYFISEGGQKENGEFVLNIVHKLETDQKLRRLSER